MSVLAPGISPSISWENVVTSQYPAVAESVREARDAAAEAACMHGAGSRMAEDIRLAVSEATSNVVRHAYRDTEPAGMFRLATRLEADHVLVTIEDDGCGLSTPSSQPGLGMGMGLMDQVADHASFRERAAGGSSVQLRFDLG